MNVTRVAAYVHLHRLEHPTGVGKHILGMVEGLRTSGRIDLALLVSQRQARKFPPETFWPSITTATFPFSFGTMQRVWLALNWPPAEEWCGPLDWVYCPAESYVPRRGAKLAVTVHDLHALETDLPWSASLRHRKFRLKWIVLFRRILKEADQLLAVSEFTKRRLIELLRVKEDSIRVIGNGVDDIFFKSACAPAGLDLHPGNYVAVVGGLSLRKGGDIVLAVAKKLEKARPGLKLAVVGTSESALAREATRRKNIVQVGYAGQCEIHRLLCHSVCLLFPSRYEGFGIPALEAMAAGAPVVASGQPALAELIGNAGLVCETADQMVSQVCRLQQNSAERAYLVGLGRARAREFTWAACSDRLIDSLQEK